MGDMLKLIWWVVTGLFRSRVALKVEIRDMSLATVDFPR
jgi:hypothetical protein